MSFWKELEEKKKEILKTSSLEEKLFYCFFTNFKDHLCNKTLKEEKLKEREKVIYKLIKNNELDTNISEQIVKQIIKDKISLEGAIVYILFYKKKDIRDFNLTFLEFFLLKEKFPNLEANFNQSPYEQKEKQALVKIIELVTKNKKFEKDLLFSALKEVRTLYDLLILERAYSFYLSKSVDLDKHFLIENLSGIIIFYNKIKNILKLLIFTSSIIALIVLANNTVDFSKFNIIEISKIIGYLVNIPFLIFVIFWGNPDKDYKRDILNYFFRLRENFLDWITLFILKRLMGTKITEDYIKELKKLLKKLYNH